MFIPEQSILPNIIKSELFALFVIHAKNVRVLYFLYTKLSCLYYYYFSYWRDCVNHINCFNVIINLILYRQCYPTFRLFTIKQTRLSLTLLSVSSRTSNRTSKYPSGR